MRTAENKSGGAKKAADRAKRYSRRKKPWRAAGRYRAAVRGTGGALRRSLYAAVFLEALVITGLKTGILPGGGSFDQMAGFPEGSDPLIEITGESEAWTEDGSSPDEPHEFPGQRKDSGVTIDWKKGRLEFWRSSQTVKPENGSDSGTDGGAESGTGSRLENGSDSGPKGIEKEN